MSSFHIATDDIIERTWFCLNCRSWAWWKKRTYLEKALILPAIILVILVIILAILLGVKLSQKDSEPAEEIIICSTSDCVKSAAAILQTIDESVDPCEDFFQFACGGYIKDRTIPDDKPSVSVFDDAGDDLDIKLKALLEKPVLESDPHYVQLVKSFYGSCMDEEYIERVKAEPIEDLVEDLGGWPVTKGRKWSERDFDWIDLLKQMYDRGFVVQSPISLSIEPDDQDQNKYVLSIHQTQLLLSSREFYLSELTQNITRKYYDLMKNIAVQLGADEETAGIELKAVLDLETELANLTLPAEETRNVSQLFNKMTVRELKEISPKVDWLKYLNGMSNNRITNDEEVVVDVIKYVKEFPNIMRKYGKRTVANYLMWYMISRSIPALHKEWRDLSQSLIAAFTGVTKEEPRWKDCIGVATQLHVAIGSYYVRNYFLSGKELAEEMVRYVHDAFLEILKAVDWMEGSTKAEAIEKAKKTTYFVGYPEQILNDTAVAEIYKDLRLSSSEGFLSNILTFTKWNINKMFSELRKKRKRIDWVDYGSPAVVNAYYSPENVILICAGILQDRMFKQDRPRYLNFGTIGSVIGHEITHGFDDEGRQYDKDGKNRNWWDHKTDMLYKNKAQCIVDQYSQYVVPEVQMNVNGKITLGENIADCGGLKEAYMAYRAWVADNGEEPLLPGLEYTANQLLWISSANGYCGKYKNEALVSNLYTNVHSPWRFRVNGPVSNLEEFSKDFQCPKGSPMNPVKKCQVW